MKHPVSLICVVAALFTSLTISATSINQPAQVVKNTYLLKSPQAKAKKVASVNKNQHVTIQQRQRAWYQILTEDKGSGWIKMLEVRFLEMTKRKGQSGLKKLWSSVTSGKSNTTVSTGVRGFDEEDLKKATAAPKQVEQLAKYSSNKEQASSFAREADIKPLDINIEQGE